MELTGTVIRGEAYGSTIGFPTANIDLADYLRRKLNLKRGIYAGFVRLDKNEEMYRAGIVVGPDDEVGQPKLEAHLIDFDGDLYGELVTFHLADYLREFQNYQNEIELKKAIQEDSSQIKTMNLCLPE